jgi:transcriptional regulator with XRE-family HTH domain
MKLSAYGRAVRKFRIEAGVMLNDMAVVLGKSPSYLSSVEAGRKPISSPLVEATIKYFADFEIDASVLRAAAEQDKKLVSIEDLHADERSLMFALAKMFPESKTTADRERMLERIRDTLNAIEKEPA